jgi:hypothetical protein
MKITIAPRSWDSGGVASALFLLCLWALPPLHAQTPPLLPNPWMPKPNVADDAGNWSSTTVEELQIRLNGFSGYRTTNVLSSNNIGGKLHHPQHIVRLPNSVGPDGKTHAYFAITQSNAFYLALSTKAGHWSDGYWMVVQIDADAYDPLTDRIFDKPGSSDGQIVYEEHFNENRDAAREEYSEPMSSKGAQFVISQAGDWNHPCKMSAFGGCC